MKKLLLIFSFSLLALAAFSVTLSEKVKDLENAAENGDAEAMYHLSTLYEHGFDSIPADSAKASHLLRRSAAAGYAPAQNYLGFSIYPAEKDSAIYWLSKAADQGEMKAVSNLAYILLEPSSPLDSLNQEERDRKAAGLLRKAADAGVVAAKATLADLYKEGRGVEKDTIQAENLYLDAIRSGLQDAEMKLLDMNAARYQTLPPDSALNEGLRASKSGAFTVAFNLYSKALEDSVNNARVHTLLADAYSSAKGVDYNHEKALRHYALGAFGGDPSARFILAELLEIFPDALNGMLADANQFLPAASPEELTSPSYWYSLAADSGITSAREAFRRLFE